MVSSAICNPSDYVGFYSTLPADVRICCDLLFGSLSNLNPPVVLRSYYKIARYFYLLVS